MAKDIYEDAKTQALTVAEHYAKHLDTKAHNYTKGADAYGEFKKLIPCNDCVRYEQQLGFHQSK
jgi:hypothetical protein